VFSLRLWQFVIQILRRYRDYPCLFNVALEVEAQGFCQGRSAFNVSYALARTESRHSELSACRKPLHFQQAHDEPPSNLPS
jgi:hypothetical protein